METKRSMSIRVTRQLYEKFFNGISRPNNFASIHIRSLIENYVEMGKLPSFDLDEVKKVERYMAIEYNNKKDFILSTKISKELREKFLMVCKENGWKKTNDVLRRLIIYDVFKRFEYSCLEGSKVDDRSEETKHKCNDTIEEINEQEEQEFQSEKSWFGRLIENMLKFLRSRFFSI